MRVEGGTGLFTLCGMSPHPSMISGVVWILAGSLALLVNTGCASRSRSIEPAEEFTLANHQSLSPFRDTDLHLARMVLNGSDIRLAGAPPITLRFTGPNRVAGQAAVNRYFGTFEFRDDGTVQWPNAAFGTTRMVGSEAATQLEQQYLQALSGTTQLLVSPEGLRFQNADGSNVVEFSR
jgi:heat shock protein HslJ